MVNLGTKFEILHAYFVLGKGYKTIANEFAPLSKNTVKKYVKEFQEQKQEILAGGDKSQILLAMNEDPQYNSQNRVRTIVTDDVLTMIQAYLDENERKRLVGKSDLCMKATDIHEELTKKGVKVSYPSVCHYVRVLSDKHKEAFIKQHYDFGEVCEFDWGDVPLEIGGREIVLKMAVFTLAASNIRFAVLYRNENTQCFLDAHIRFFAFLGKVPHTFVYDNMRVAIAKFVGKNERVATLALKQLSTYYGFNFRFCNIRKANEKGHVERSVEVVRRKAFCVSDAFADIDAATEKLNAKLLELNADKHELLEREKAAMLPKMPDYSCADRVSAKVDKYSVFAYSNVRYSVPDYLVGREVDVYAFVDEVVVRHKGNAVAKHKRSYEAGAYVLDIMHYVRTLLRKPGAVKNSLCLKQAGDALKALFETHFSGNPKDFVMFLIDSEKHSLTDIEKAVKILADGGIRVCCDNLKMVLGNRRFDEQFESADDVEKACEMQLRKYMEAAV